MGGAQQCWVNGWAQWLQRMFPTQTVLVKINEKLMAREQKGHELTSSWPCCLLASVRHWDAAQQDWATQKPLWAGFQFRTQPWTATGSRRILFLKIYEISNLKFLMYIKINSFCTQKGRRKTLLSPCCFLPSVYFLYFNLWIWSRNQLLLLNYT